jgi:hypothetical protein
MKTAAPTLEKLTLEKPGGRRQKASRWFSSLSNDTDGMRQGECRWFSHGSRACEEVGLAAAGASD